MDLEHLLDKVSTGKKINVAVGTPVVLTPEGMTSHYKCALVGIGFESYLIVTTPQIPGSMNRLGVGSQVLVRYMADGNVYGFESSILGSVGRPVRVTFLAYPKIVQSHNLRKSPRAGCQIPATVVMNGKEYSGLIIDISRGGCRFCTRTKAADSQDIGVNQDVELLFQLPGVKDGYTVGGVVRNVSQDESQATVGIEFVFQEEGGAAFQIQRFVDRILSVNP